MVVLEVVLEGCLRLLDEGSENRIPRRSKYEYWRGGVSNLGGPGSCGFYARIDVLYANRAQQEMPGRETTNERVSLAPHGCVKDDVA